MKKTTLRSSSSERMTASSVPGASWRNSQGEEVQQLTAKNHQLEMEIGPGDFKILELK